MNAFNVIYLIFKILGALALFLYGMKLMSESLQKLAGIKLRNIIFAMTSNKLKAVFSGLILTAIIQSSSASTVMLVSFVNAGILSLTESIAVMMGANIGTTIKIWLITLLGVKFNISDFILPLIGLSLPLLFFKKNYFKSWGDFIIGFCLLFLGIGFLFQIFPENQQNAIFLQIIQKVTDLKNFATIIFVFTGFLLTAILQSSSATITITIVMSLNGLLTFENAAAMVLGENIGTTITANIAAIVANRSAKKMALSHSLFNIVGLVWVLLLFSPFLKLINDLLLSFTGQSPFIDNRIIPLSLCIFHTSFNVINTLILIGLIPLIIKILEFLIPEKKKKQKYKLKNIDVGFLSTSEFSLKLVQKEIVEYAKMQITVIETIPYLLVEKDDLLYKKHFEKILKKNLQSVKKESEILRFLNSISRGELSRSGIMHFNSMIKVCELVKDISDSLLEISQMIDEKNSKKIWFTQTMRNRLNEMKILIVRALINMINNLESNFEEVSIIYAYEIENQINTLKDKLLIENEEAIKSEIYSYQTSIVYQNIILNFEKTADLILNVNESIVNK